MRYDWPEPIFWLLDTLDCLYLRRTIHFLRLIACSTCTRTVSPAAAISRARRAVDILHHKGV